MKNYKNNENNIEKIVNEISYLSERFKDLQNIWHPEKMEDYFSSYYERIKKSFFDSSSQNKNYLKNFVNFWKIFSFNDSDVSENVLFNKIFDKNELYNLKKRLNEKSEIEEKITFLIIFIIKFIKSFKKELVFIDITETEEKEIIEKLHFEDNVDWYYRIFKNYLSVYLRNNFIINKKIKYVAILILLNRAPLSSLQHFHFPQQAIH